MKIKLGIIGAGEISAIHLKALKNISDIDVAAICDVNEATAKKRAQDFGIPTYYTNYRSILEDENIDAVDIVTPTFTHCTIVTDALKSGKHVFCEKPPALTYEEALSMENMAKGQKKLLMYGLVCRFKKETSFVKEYIDAGRLGKIYSAEICRTYLCHTIGGWFRDKEKSGGGCMMDAAIHQLDMALYFMGYPSVKSVRAFSTDVNKDLPDIMRGLNPEYTSVNNTSIERTVESFMNGYIMFENDQVLYVKAGHITNAVEPSTGIELVGENGGIIYGNNKTPDIVTIDRELNYYFKSQPIIENITDPYEEELNHFADCITTGKECICKPGEGTELIKILNALYKSAETKEEIIF